jgi:hypothetical protein
MKAARLADQTHLGRSEGWPQGSPAYFFFVVKVCAKSQPANRTVASAMLTIRGIV